MTQGAFEGFMMLHWPLAVASGMAICTLFLLAITSEWRGFVLMGLIVIGGGALVIGTLIPLVLVYEALRWGWKKVGSPWREQLSNARSDVGRWFRNSGWPRFFENLVQGIDKLGQFLEGDPYRRDRTWWHSKTLGDGTRVYTKRQYDTSGQFVAWPELDPEIWVIGEESGQASFYIRGSQATYCNQLTGEELDGYYMGECHELRNLAVSGIDRKKRMHRSAVLRFNS